MALGHVVTSAWCLGRHDLEGSSCTTSAAALGIQRDVKQGRICSVKGMMQACSLYVVKIKRVSFWRRDTDAVALGTEKHCTTSKRLG